MQMIEATYKDHMGSDLTVVNAARVSFGKERKAIGYTSIDGGPDIPVLADMDKKLINYLAKHKHMSPFGHAFVTFHVKAPIFVARQLVKHKFLRWNEISRRYVDDKPEFYVPEVWRGKSEDKKQGSDGVVALSAWALQGIDEYGTEYDEVCLHVYETLLREGVAPEQARMVLPQSTMTEWYWSGSLDAFADMCNLRCKPDTQAETRVVADQINHKMLDLFPVSWSALIDY
jgi:thymidylate synthase (FAD)